MKQNVRNDEFLIKYQVKTKNEDFKIGIFKTHTDTHLEVA